MAKGRGGGAWAEGASLMRDYWLDEPRGPCGGGCGHLLHELIDLYMDDPSSRTPPTELEKTIVQMFEARFTASFVLDDLYEFAGDPDEDLHHYKVKAVMQRVPIEASRFRGMVNRFLGSLDPAQKRAMAPMNPTAKKIFALEKATSHLRDLAAHPDGDVHGIISKATRTDDGEPEPEDKVIKSAHLIAMYVDFAMHRFPERFRSALSKAFVGDLHARLPNPESLVDAIAAFKKANPIGSMRLDRVKPENRQLVSELLRERNSLQIVSAAYAHLSRIKLGSGKMGRLWVRIQRRKLAYYSQYVTLEVINFFDLYARLKGAGLVDHEDGAVRLLNRHEEEMRKARQLVAHWEPGRDFVACVNLGIGYERLLLVAALAGEWARLNANAYTEEIGLDGIPELDQMVRRLSLGRIEHEVAQMRMEAGSRAAGAPGQGRPS